MRFGDVAHTADRLIAEVASAEDPLPVYVTVGDDDVFDFFESSTAFYAALQEAEIESELRITDGGHTWAVWSEALDEVLVFFAESFEAYY